MIKLQNPESGASTQPIQIIHAEHNGVKYNDIQQVVADISGLSQIVWCKPYWIAEKGVSGRYKVGFSVVNTEEPSAKDRIGAYLTAGNIYYYGDVLSPRTTVIDTEYYAFTSGAIEKTGNNFTVGKGGTLSNIPIPVERIKFTLGINYNVGTYSNGIKWGTVSPQGYIRPYITIWVDKANVLTKNVDVTINYSDLLGGEIQMGSKTFKILNRGLGQNTVNQIDLTNDIKNANGSDGWIWGITVSVTLQQQAPEMYAPSIEQSITLGEEPQETTTTTGGSSGGGGTETTTTTTTPEGEEIYNDIETIGDWTLWQITKKGDNNVK